MGVGIEILGVRVLKGLVKLEWVFGDGRAERAPAEEAKWKQSPKQLFIRLDLRIFLEDQSPHLLDLCLSFSFPSFAFFATITCFICFSNFHWSLFSLCYQCIFFLSSCISFLFIEKSYCFNIEF